MAMTHPVILVIDDDSALRTYLRATLQAFGYHVQEAPTGERGLVLVVEAKPDLVLLDLGLPDMDGLDLARQLRTWSRVPLIVVSGRRREEDMVSALDAGADDYLAKPFGVGELLARIRVAFRHAGSVVRPVPSGVVTLGPLTVDLDSREVTVGGRSVHLSPNEYIILAALLKQPGKVLTHHELLRQVQGEGSSPHATGLLRVYMANLRRKLEPDPGRTRLLATEPGVGYRLQGVRE
jgi:two-component system, OmpR family, KDP operon response regulator KdpE